MPPTDGSMSASGRGPVRDRLDRLRQTYGAAPLPLKLLIVVVCCVVGCAIAIIFFRYASISGSRALWATASVTIVGVALVSGLPQPGAAAPRYSLFVLPVVTAFAAHAGALGRWYVPGRTVAWILLLALLPGIGLFRLLDSGTSFIGPGLAWLVAFVVLGSRLAKAWRDSKQSGQPQPARGGGPMGPPWSAGQAGMSGYPGQAGYQAAAQPTAGGQVRPGRRVAGGRPGADLGGRIMTAGRTGQIGQAAQVAGSAAADRGDRSAADRPGITVEGAMAGLDAMIGLAAGNDQVRSIAASIEAARRRALARIGADKPMQHFVFLGPPGTGKTAAARIGAKGFYAFCLLGVPTVVR